MKLTNPIPLEEEVQAQIIQYLELKGYLVYQTTVRYKRLPDGSRPYGGYGCDPGVPDLLVRHKLWPRGMLLGLEVKRPGKWRFTRDAKRRTNQDGQRDAHQAGVFFVVTGYEDAQHAVQNFESVLLSQG